MAIGSPIEAPPVPPSASDSPLNPGLPGVVASLVSSLNASTERGRESLALGAGAIALTIVALVTMIVFRLQPFPIAGEGSIGQYGANTSAVVAFGAFIAGRFAVPNAPRSRRRLLDVIDVAVLAFAHAAIALLSWTLVAVVLERGFIDAVVFGLPSALVAGTMAAITAYVVFCSATNLSLESVAVVLAVFLVEGVVASMLTASDPHWWKENLSALGMPDDASGNTFNLTLIIGGIMITTLARFITRDISTTHRHGVACTRLCLVVLGLLLALVGSFPADNFYWVHTGFAAGVAAVFGVLVALTPRWTPGMPGAFIVIGWFFIAVLAMLFIFFAVGYYTLTAVELVAGILVLVWITLFIRNVGVLGSRRPAG